MKFEIVEYEFYRHVCFYTIHNAYEPLSETDSFFQRLTGQPELLADLAEIKAIIVKMGRSRDGAQEERFRFEDNVRALPKTRNDLRLYCIRCHSNTVILCNGGQKTSQKVQDSPDAYPHFLLAKTVEKLYRARIQDETIENRGCFINGDRSFDTDLFDT